MRKTIKNTFRVIIAGGFALLLFSNLISAAPIVRTGNGVNAAAIQSIVDQFRTDLGGANNGVGGSFTSGRREVNWDGVPDAFSEPNNFPPNFFNVNSPRGVVFNAIEDATGGGLNQFAVSSTAASGVPVRFGNIHADYSNIFQTFSTQRLFMARNTHILEVGFFIPGTKIPATVKGFGIIFADVDSAGGGDRSLIRVYGADGAQLIAVQAQVNDNGLSFVGISFNAGERISRVVIESGNSALSANNTDEVNGVDVVAMDDFIYGEPRAAESHPGDYDGDGGADLTVFRPSSGEWFTLHSGSNTFSQVHFGQNGDIPIDGDFDGDSRNDVTVFRPSEGVWYRLNSADGSFFAVQFGLNGDRPVAGDYDKDGKADIAVWRPSSGDHFFLRSGNGQFQAQHWGLNGDIPVMAAGQ
jgi:hypothetical protein